MFSFKEQPLLIQFLNKVKARLRSCFKTTQYPPVLEFYNNVEITIPIKTQVHRLEQSIPEILVPFGTKPKPP